MNNMRFQRSLLLNDTACDTFIQYHVKNKHMMFIELDQCQVNADVFSDHC